MKIRVRVAPSPTGFMHIGTAQSALYNWLFARKNGGSFYLRIEDTDRERSTKEYEQNILDALKWLGLDWDGEVVRQSERVDVYEKYLRKLFNDGQIFWCNHSKQELEDEKKGQVERKESIRHVCSHKFEKRNSGQVLRLKNDSSFLRITENPRSMIDFKDLIRGEIYVPSEILGDFSIAKDFQTPLYNFAAVVDDIDMEITHVIRGEDHISNTPKQILIYEALGKQPPQFAHLPLILAPDRSKLSKRHGAVAVIDYKKDYLPEALINFLGGLSYTFSKEILRKEDMIGEFELSKVHKSGAIFDVKKLNWINSQYIRRLTPSEFKKALRQAQDKLPDIPDAAVPLITERLEKLTDTQEFSYLWSEPEYDPSLLIWKKSLPEEVKNSLKKVKELFEKHKELKSDALRKELDQLGGANRGLVYWPLRVALSGKEKSPDPVEIALVLGKNEVVRRIDRATEVLK